MLFPKKGSCTSAPQEIHFSGRPDEQTRGRGTTTFLHSYVEDADAVCGVCLPVRKMVPVCSENHTGEPVHPQDPLSTRARSSLPLRFASLHLCPRPPRFNLLPPSATVASTTILSSRRVFLSVSGFNDRTHPPFEIPSPPRCKLLSWIRIMSNVRKPEFIRVETWSRFSRWRIVICRWSFYSMIGTSLTNNHCTAKVTYRSFPYNCMLWNIYIDSFSIYVFQIDVTYNPYLIV